MGLLRHFFTYVPPEPPPELPETEPPDPNLDRSLSEPYRAARRSLVAVCALCIAWGTAQFSLADLSLSAVGLSINLKNASVPLLLGVALVYFAARWASEFAMMTRHVRRWPLAQLDFRIVAILARVSLLALGAGALDRSSRTLATIAMVVVGLVVSVSVLTVLLMFVTMPVRMWARGRAGRGSAANAAIEAMFWAGFFAVCLTAAGTIVTALISYRNPAWRSLFWRESPDPLALAIFALLVVVVFLSHWLLRPLMKALFAERPSYRTERSPDGNMIIRSVPKVKEPLV